MLWLKAFHIVFVVTWFAGLFYLPRLFVYHASATDEAGRERFKVMERRLFAMMTIGVALAAAFGVAMLVHAPALLSLRLAAGEARARRPAHRLSPLVLPPDAPFRADANRHSERWFRLFNEAPSLLLIAIVLLAVLKPF